MNNEDLAVSIESTVATVLLNRPESHNAINIQMYKDLPEIFKKLEADTSVKVVVIRGAGNRSFASGADISEFEKERGNAEAAKNYNEKVAEAEHAIERLTKPTIAMIHGYCIGGGAGLALACDIRFADDNARFAITPAKLGLVYSLESTKRMVDLVGPSRSRWVLFSGLQIKADRALQLGLFDEVLDVDELESSTYKFAEVVSTRAQFSVRSGKEMVRRITAGQTADDDETVHIRNSSFSTEDYREGVQAFIAKRKPEFSWS